MADAGNRVADPRAAGVEPIEAVIFDIGKVLVDWSLRALYEQLIDDPEERDWFLTHVVTPEWHTHHDAGRPMDEGIRLLSEAYPAYAPLIAALKPRWSETLVGPIAGSVRALEALDDAGIPVYGLTNYLAETFLDFCRDYPFSVRFRDVVVSGEHGVIKPDPRIYDLMIERFGVTPERTVFIDDKPENVAAGRDKGLIALHFTDPGRLWADLRALALPI